MNQAQSALAMNRALDRLSDEYSGRPDAQQAIHAFQEALGPSQMALLFALVLIENTETV